MLAALHGKAKTVKSGERVPTVDTVFLNDVESRPRCGDDVTVRLLLHQLHRLLLLQDQEAVELGGRLLPVVVPAEVEQTDRLGARLGHHSLR